MLSQELLPMLRKPWQLKFHFYANKFIIRFKASMVDMGLGCIDWWEQPDSGEIKQELADNDSNAH